MLVALSFIYHPKHCHKFLSVSLFGRTLKNVKVTPWRGVLAFEGRSCHFEIFIHVSIHVHFQGKTLHFHACFWHSFMLSNAIGPACNQNLYPQRRPTTTLGLDWRWEFSFYTSWALALRERLQNNVVFIWSHILRTKGRVITSGMSSFVLQKSS
jgi:hypothetical protein